MSLAYNWRIGSGRGRKSLIAPERKRTVSADGSRWVIGQNVKRSLPDHRYDAVRKYWLKERQADRSIATDWTFDLAEARAWINVTEETYL